MASDDFALSGLNNAGITETVPIVEEAPEPEPVYTYATLAYATSVPVYEVPAPQMANYTVSFYINTKEEYINTYQNLSYSGIYKFSKMVYGHNTWNLLGNLVNRYAGEVFTVTEGGVTREYRVADVQIYRKTENGLEDDPRLMTRIATTALGHDLALLTCYGTSYGNGDASHRLVVFADAI